jgi:hypothetical protein
MFKFYSSIIYTNINLIKSLGYYQIKKKPKKRRFNFIKYQYRRYLFFDFKNEFDEPLKVEFI